MKTIISDRQWHSSPTLNYSIKYEAERANVYDKTVRVRFQITMRSIYSSCNFRYPLYVKISINNKEYTVTSSFGTGVKSVNYTTEWISFESEGISKSVTFTLRCGDMSHTSKDSGKISFPEYKEPAAKITTHKISNIGLDKISISCSTDIDVDLVQYRINGGSWKTASSLKYTISNLNPNTKYTIETRVRSKNGGVYTTSSKLSATTLDIAKISDLSDFNHGDNININITNPANISSLNLKLKVEQSEIFNRDNIKGGENSIEFSDSELDSIYKLYGTSSMVTADFELVGEGYSYVDQCKIHLTGNQKNGHRNINGVWKRCKRWRNIDGEWKRVCRWINIDGEWRRCI